MPRTKVGLVSLGCAKNLIDSEIMIGHLQQGGMVMTPEAELADVLIINTCSFIDIAKKESIASVHEAVDSRADSKKRAKQKIIVAGCMAQRFAQELPNLMPDVDAFIGLDQLTQVAPIIEKLMGNSALRAEPSGGLPARQHSFEQAGSSRDGSGLKPELQAPLNFVTQKPQYIPDYDTPRFRLTPKHFAYIKIAEGCNHPCSFCIIPKIRGQHRSRTQESVVKEAGALVKSGVKEINLISQDTTYFGMDKWEGRRPNPRSGVDSSRGESLATLIREINKIEGDFWIRLLYTHPAHWSDDLIQAISECDKVARYADIPLQHISDHMLTLMKRETDGAFIRDLIRRMRAGIPGLAIRTTFIVGFPNETGKDFNELLDFINEFKFERAGVFNYSREEGTRAHKMEGHVHHATRRRRWDAAMLALQERAEELNQSQVGRTLRVLVESPGVARTYMDAPEIDGTVFVDKKLPVGEFASVTIRDWRGYDLVAHK